LIGSKCTKKNIATPNNLDPIIPTYHASPPLILEENTLQNQTKNRDNGFKKKQSLTQKIGEKIQVLFKKIKHLVINSLVCQEHNLLETTQNLIETSIAPEDYLFEHLETIIELPYQKAMAIAKKSGCTLHAPEYTVNIYQENNCIATEIKICIAQVTHRGITTIAQNSLFEIHGKLTFYKGQTTANLGPITIHEKDERFNPYWFLSDSASDKKGILSAYGIHNDIINKLHSLGKMGVISSDVLLLKKQIAMLKCASLITSLYKEAAQTGHLFVKGSFSIEDKEKKLYDTMYSLAKKASSKHFYDRKPPWSSHYTDSPDQHGLDIVLEENAKNNYLDILPDGRHHILFGSVNKGNKQKGTYVKCEHYGLASTFDYINHAKQYVKYRLSGRNKQGARRETDLPIRFATLWIAYCDAFGIKNSIKEEAYVYEIDENVKNQESQKDIEKDGRYHILKALREKLNGYEKTRGPLYLITGNEFVIRQTTTDKLLENLNQKMVLKFD